MRLSCSDLTVGMCAVSGSPRSACRPLTANAGACARVSLRALRCLVSCPSFVPRGEDELWLAVELLGPRTCTLPSCFRCQAEQRSGSPSTGSPFPDVKLHLSWAHGARASASSLRCLTPVLLAFSFVLTGTEKAECSLSCPGTMGTSTRSGLAAWPWAHPWPLPVGRAPGPGSRASPPRCLNSVLEELKSNGKAEVMVASHNQDTVRFTLRR